MLRSAVAVSTIVLLASGCVSLGKYDAAVESANEARADERTQIAALRDQMAGLDRRIEGLQGQLDAANAKLADQTAASRADIDRLRREQAATEVRAALFRDLAHKLAKMVDAGELRIACCPKTGPGMNLGAFATRSGAHSARSTWRLLRTSRTRRGCTSRSRAPSQRRGTHATRGSKSASGG
jgi:cell division protein FtsB